MYAVKRKKQIIGADVFVAVVVKFCDSSELPGNWHFFPGKVPRNKSVKLLCSPCNTTFPWVL